MVRFLLKQGANPAPKDRANRNALILAIDANQPSCVGELAPYSRDDLDTALLYAAAQGKHHVIATLTSFGASVYTRHDGGMTPLMLAAENGHTTTVYALLESGSNRFAIDEHGRTAAQIAAAASHETIAELLNRDPDEGELSITEPSDTEGVVWKEPHPTPNEATPSEASSNVVAQHSQQAEHSKTTPQTTTQTASNHNKPNTAPNTPRQTSQTTKPRHIPFIANQTISSHASTPKHITQDLKMRDYQRKDLPFIVEKTSPKAAHIRMLYGNQKQTTVRQGEIIPKTPFRVVSIQQKFHDSKMTDGKLADISIVEIEDTHTGTRRKLTSKIPAAAAEPWAVLVDIGSGQPYAARAGQTFRTANGDLYTVTDVRPNQIVLTHQKSGQVITIPLGS
jgi:hypothetical protein